MSQSTHGAPYTLFVVPPNVTGNLHLGHAMMIAVQDALVRWKRLNGQEVAFWFGTDHGGISTQYVVEQELKNQNMNRLDLGRERFLEKVKSWVEEYKKNITRQVYRLGGACDWSRDVMTMDEPYYSAVLHSFVQLHEQGLIYHGNYVVNWCTHCQTTLSDLETDMSRADVMVLEMDWEVEGESALISVLVASPERLLDAGGLLVADGHHLAGMRARNPVTGEWLPVLADTNLRQLDLLSERTDSAVLFVPGHDRKHFSKARSLGMFVSSAFDKNGRLQRVVEISCEASTRSEAAEWVCEQTARQIRRRLSVEVEQARCSRCGHIILPLLSDQWFLRMQPLAANLLPKIESGEIAFYPESAREQTMNWLLHLEDWCLSRQNWWGHPLPVYRCRCCQDQQVSLEPPAVCTQCGSNEWEASTDVLDTWFSSAHWNFAYLGWPEQTDELNRHYPASLIETGRDILFFWVIRMMLLGLHHMGEVPAKEIYLHGLVTDEHGQKMSKSKGNVIDAEQVLNEYGSDVLRFVLLESCEAGVDLALSPQRFVSVKKLQDGLFLLANAWQEACESSEVAKATENPFSPKMEAWVRARVRELQQAAANLHRYEFKSYARTACEVLNDLYAYWLPWLQMMPADGRFQPCLQQLLVGLHPIFPETTSKLWEQCGQGEMSIAKLPEQTPALELGAESLLEAVRLLRVCLGLMGEEAMRQMTAVLEGAEGIEEFLHRLVSLSSFSRKQASEAFELELPTLSNQTLRLSGPADLEWDRLLPYLARNAKQASQVVSQLKKRLGNPQFHAHASKDQIETQRRRLDEGVHRLDLLRKAMQKLQNRTQIFN